MTQVLHFTFATRRAAPRPSIVAVPAFTAANVVERERAHFAAQAGVNPRLASPATQDFLAKAKLAKAV